MISRVVVGFDNRVDGGARVGGHGMVMRIGKFVHRYERGSWLLGADAYDLRCCNRHH